MTTVHYDSNLPEQDMRVALYHGDIFVFSPRESQRKLCDHAKKMTLDAFCGLDPVTAHDHLSPDEYIKVLADLKPRFIHDKRSKELLQDILRDFECSPATTYFDVPRLRTVTPYSYLSSGLAYVFKPHRDTWYSTPMCQLNWWLPVCQMNSENTMAFHTAYWDKPVKNSSVEFDYQDWEVGGRRDAVKHVKADTRRQSEALEPIDPEPQLRLVPDPGSMVIFSAAHLHSTVPNTSHDARISVDFRTVDLADIEAGQGAANLDSRSRGTTTRDYLRLDDLAHLPDRLIETHLREGSTPPPVERANASPL